MGEIVVCAATSHAPGIVANRERADAGQASRFYAGMAKLRQAFEEAKANVIIEIYNDHFTNFYFHSMPAICVGTAATYIGPVDSEAWLRIPQRTVPGQPELAKALVREALNFGFDLSFSEDLALDHSSMVPLHFITPATDVPVVPIIVNDVAEPMPTPQRVYQFGALIRSVVEGRPKGERVAVLGTGGLSHWVGTPEMGLINVDFDERFLEAVERGNGHLLAEYTPEEIGRGGNGAHEVRNWIAVMGALPGVKGDVVAYEPVVPWVTGCGAVIWRV